MVKRSSRKSETISCFSFIVKMEAKSKQYPKVLEVVDTETAAELSQQECAALIKVMKLKNNLTDIEMQTVYFRGCYDGVGYLKKADIL